ncbi:dUTP diphosphatase [Curtobacterium sp. MCBD17_040]|uniref:dUTP diphosphatase n=1 Tax=Curtobacterium sp. MCBD17_040 TaxID=2175674 RepID=UPI000DA80D71|nr:dUTP diphosphatase [Curtobacterium sp. MCBD17_040]WIB65334.1 dUTP diphosphatase [Curtobacterium sp. MCBD17_040]
MTTLRIARVGAHTVPAPAYANHDDAGLDLRTVEAVTLLPGERTLVPTGFALAIPTGHVGLVHPRSGLAAKHGVTVLNTPGTIDAGYRGEVKVLLHNAGTQPFRAEAGDRIAQLVIQEYTSVTVEEADTLDVTDRGDRGFGSTGVA